MIEVKKAITVEPPANMKLNPAVAIIFFIIIFAANVVNAVNKNNMDVVLVMDSTGSMKKTDPLSLRIPAAKLFISLLDKNDHAGVISFSDSAVPLSSLISLDGGDSKNILSQAIDKITSTGLHTNLYEAFNKGLEALSTEKDNGRERILVLMSDGLMDTGDPEKDKSLIEKLKTDLTKMLIEKGIKVYAIAFTAQSDIQLLEKVSKQTGGFYNLALTDKDIHVVFTSIFESLKTPDMLPVSDNGFLIDRSVEEVTIVATKESTNTTIQLNSPDSKKYSSRNKPFDTEWFVTSNFDMMTMKKPAEGRWEILFSTGKNNKAYVITNLNLQTNFNELYPLFGQTLDIRLWLEREGKPIKEKEILDRIGISIELSKPDGETIRLQPFNKGDGVFERKVELYTAGNYKLRFVADGKTFQREKTFAFKVSDAKESKEDIKARQALKKPEGQAPPKDNTAHDVNWRKVIVQFITINLVFGIVALVYLKRKSLKNFSDIKKLLKPNAIKAMVKKGEKGPKPRELKEGQSQEQLTKGKEEEDAVKGNLKATEEPKEMEEEKQDMTPEGDQEIDTTAEITVQDTENGEKEQVIEPKTELQNDVPKEQEIKTDAEVPGPQETTDKETDKVNEQQQQEDLDELIAQLEKEQQERTEKKEKDNDTN